jgi:hypothetical protein
MILEFSKLHDSEMLREMFLAFLTQILHNSFCYIFGYSDKTPEARLSKMARNAISVTHRSPCSVSRQVS